MTTGRNEGPVGECRAVGFDGTDPRFQQALEVRLEVFVGEQRIPAWMELDDLDAVCWHVIVQDTEGRAWATGRLYGDAHDPRTVHLGRIAVRRDARGTGLGVVVMDALMAEARRRGFTRAVLSSQVQASGFYERVGFRRTGTEYYDAGIPHVDMQRSLVA